MSTKNKNEMNDSSEIPSHFLSIDENGFIYHTDQNAFAQNEGRITDADFGKEILKNLHFLSNFSLCSSIQDRTFIIEAFDAPLVAQSVEKNTPVSDEIVIQFNYGFNSIVSAESLFVDEWDRIYGELENSSLSAPTSQKVPFVFSRKAQEQFFDLMDEFDDDFFVWNGEKFSFNSAWGHHEALSKSQSWNDQYGDETNKPRWQLSSPCETLKDMLPRLKLPKSRVLILGSGESCDPAHFAEQGHVVTAVDFSEKAIQNSRKKYSHLSNIHWVEGDIFKLPDSYHKQFDLVYEYTCFCAIDPKRRNELVKVWSQCLHEQGQLMATFFIMHKRDTAPLGATEWELRKRLQKRFQFLFWGRWKKSLPRRQGIELFVLAKKNESHF